MPVATCHGKVVTKQSVMDYMLQLEAAVLEKIGRFGR